MIEEPHFFSSTLVGEGGEVGEGVMVEGGIVEGGGQGRWQASKVETQVTRNFRTRNDQEGFTSVSSHCYLDQWSRPLAMSTLFYTDFANLQTCVQ